MQLLPDLSSSEKRVSGPRTNWYLWARNCIGPSALLSYLYSASNDFHPHHNSPSDLQGQEVTICTDALLGVPFMLFASDICSRNSAMEVGSAPMNRPTDTIGLRSIERIL